MNYIYTAKHIIKNDLVVPKTFLHQINDHFVTHIISSNINNCLSISCNRINTIMKY